MRVATTERVLVHIVDDDDVARGGLQELLNSHRFPTESYPSAGEFLDKMPIVTPGCLLLESHMSGLTGMELQQILVERRCRIPIVFLTTHGDIPTSVIAIKRGAEDFLCRPADERDVLDAVDRAVQRSLDNFEADARRSDAFERASRLTEREREVCSYLITGLLSKQIARRLIIAERTVKAHKARILEKFDIRSIAELVLLANLAGVEAADTRANRQGTESAANRNPSTKVKRGLHSRSPNLAPASVSSRSSCNDVAIAADSASVRVASGDD